MFLNSSVAFSVVIPVKAAEQYVPAILVYYAIQLKMVSLLSVQMTS